MSFSNCLKSLTKGKFDINYGGLEVKSVGFIDQSEGKVGLALKYNYSLLVGNKCN